MKKKFLLFSISGFIVVCFVFVQCQKHTSSLNVTLYDKPLNVIQSYIQGKWKLEYANEGTCSNCYNNFYDKNFIWEFDGGISVKQTYMGILQTDTLIEWKKDLLGAIGPDSTFVMYFYDKRQYPSIYQVQGIFDDSLILRDWSDNDVVFYHFSKQN